ncbi:MAG: hypothetical protein KDD25_07420, partial [Bdellovibrionales bacterium]|nr:hypothetical protein [Bdellovibrionales bacterium]
SLRFLMQRFGPIAYMGSIGVEARNYMTGQEVIPSNGKCAMVSEVSEREIVNLLATFNYDFSQGGYHIYIKGYYSTDCSGEAAVVRANPVAVHVRCGDGLINVGGVCQRDSGNPPPPPSGPTVRLSVLPIFTNTYNCVVAKDDNTCRLLGSPLKLSVDSLIGPQPGVRPIVKVNGSPMHQAELDFITPEMPWIRAGQSYTYVVRNSQDTVSLSEDFTITARCADGSEFNSNDGYCRATAGNPPPPSGSVLVSVPSSCRIEPGQSTCEVSMTLRALNGFTGPVVVKVVYSAFGSGTTTTPVASYNLENAQQEETLIIPWIQDVSYAQYEFIVEPAGRPSISREVFGACRNNTPNYRDTHVCE